MKKQNMRFSGLLAIPELAIGTFFNKLSISWGKLVSPIGIFGVRVKTLTPNILFLHRTIYHFLLAYRKTMR
jgi:hypothetical protein